MALADILRKIAEDAAREADGLILEAEADADEVRARAQTSAGAMGERVVAEARERAEAGARSRLARARITARDSALAARREMVERVLAEAVARLEDQPAPQYAALISAEVAGSARGGERLQIAEADRERLEGHLPSALVDAGVVDIEVAGPTDTIARGVLLVGDRVRTEISAAAIVAEHADALTARIAGVLFDSGASGGDA